MGFVHPLYLLGLAAASIPVILHLLHRRNPRRVEFPAMELVRRSVRRTRRRFRLRQLLLLITRTLLVTFAVLAVAGPMSSGAPRDMETTGPPTAVALVLDGSMSMRLGRGEAFEEAKAIAREVFQGLRPQDKGALVTAGAVGVDVAVNLTGSREALLAALDRTEPGYGVADLGEALTRARVALGSSKLPVKKVMVVSDFRGPSRLTVPWTPGKEGEPYVIPVAVPGADQVPRDLAITGVRVTRGAGPRTYTFDVTCRVTPGFEAAGARIDLMVDGEVVNSGLLDDSGEGRELHERLQVTLEPGPHRCEAVARVDDDLPADDRRALVVEVEPPVEVLLVDGAPSQVPQEDELFYLERALDVVTSREVRVTVTGVAGLPAKGLAPFSVVVLANVQSLGPDQVERLEGFVREGGGLLITVGDNVDPELYDQRLGDLLPRRIRGVREIPEGTRPGTLMAGSPLVEPMLGPGGEGLRAATTRRYVLVEPGGGARVEVHMKYETGAPMLLEVSLGRGRVAMLTTTIDRDWTDLPIRTGFQPLMEGLVLHLAGGHRGGARGPITVGEELSFPLPGDAQRAILVAPGGERRAFGPDDVGVREVLSAGPARVPGVYELRVTGERGGLSTSLVAVISDPAEVDLTHREPPTLPRPDLQGARGDEVRRPIWHWLLAGLALLLALEGVLVSKASVRVTGAAPGAVPGTRGSVAGR